MKFTKYKLIIFFLIAYQILLAQSPFVKLSNIVYNKEAIVAPATQGWIVMTGDSIRLTKFNNCGVIEWSKKYNLPPVQYGLYDFIALRNGDYALMYRFNKNNLSITAVTRFDANGIIIWSNSYGDTNHEHYPYSIMEDNAGHIYFYANIAEIPAPNVFNSLTKLNANGTIIWTKLYDHGWVWGKGIVTSDQGVLLRTGSTLIKTDTNGNVQWSKDVLSNTTNYFAPVEVIDGFIMTGRNSATNNISFYKFDLLGNQLWGGAKEITNNGKIPYLFKTPSGNFVGIFNKAIASNSFLTLIEFDKDLTIVSENSVSIPNSLTGQSLCFLTDGTPVVCGITNSGQLFEARFATDYKISCTIPLASTVVNNYPVSIANVSFSTSTHNYNLHFENQTYTTTSSNVTTLCSTTKHLELGNDTSFCENTIILRNQTADVFDIYTWSTGETTSSITVNHGGTYILNGKDFCGDVNLTDTITITKLTTAFADAGADAILCENESTVLQVKPCAGCTYNWSNGSVSDTTLIKEPGIYTVSVKNPDGCKASDTVEVTESKCECDIYLPNAFTPNNDNKNEIFKPLFYCELADYKFSIFNRWGEEIFSTDNPINSWNGKYNGNEVPEGVYVYFLQYTAVIRGDKTNPFMKNGIVTLIR